MADKKQKITVISANYDKTSSFGKGADKGPAAIIECLNKQVEIYERFTKTESLHAAEIKYKNLGDLNRLSPEEMTERVKEEYKKENFENFVLILGGEHSVSNGAFKAIAAKEKARNITIVQIDAHMDLRDDDSDYAAEPHGKYAHCSVMRRAHELGFKIVQIGVRAYSKEELNYAVRNKIKFFEWGKGKVPSAAQIIKSIKTKKVYLTIDVDGIDPCHMPATGTPVQGGLEWYYTLNLIRKLFAEKEVIAADIVEVAPRPNDTLTEYGAAQILYNMIAYALEKAEKEK